MKNSEPLYSLPYTQGLKCLETGGGVLTAQVKEAHWLPMSGIRREVAFLPFPTL